MVKTVKYSQRGLTLLEVLISIAIFSLLAGFGTISLLNSRTTTSANTTIYSLITDIKTQQNKAMSGDTEGRGTPDVYSIYIQNNQYTLFHGVNYSMSDTSNTPITVPAEFTLSTTFPSDKIIFASGSGEIVGYTQGQDTITFTNTSTNHQSSIRINKYGTVTNITP